MKIYSLFVLLLALLLFSCNKTTQKSDAKKDSLAVYLKIAGDLKISTENRLSANEKAFKIISRQKNDSLKLKNYFKVAKRYYNCNDFVNYRNVSKEITVLSLDAKDSLSLSKAYTNLGDYFSNAYKADSAYYYYSKAEKLYRLLKNKIKLAEVLINKAIFQSNIKDYAGSEKSVFEALQILDKNDKEILYKCLNLLGIIYGELNEYDKSIEYHNRALEVIKKENAKENAESILISLNNIGLIYQNKKDYKKSIFYFEKALREKKHLKIFLLQMQL